MRKHYFRFFIFAFFFVGCVATAPSVSQKKVTELSLLLQSLDSSIPKSEVMRLSQDIFHETQKLTKEFEMTSPPQFHNFLVTVGVREKGLCYHWSDALYDYLSGRGYPSAHADSFGHPAVFYSDSLPVVNL